MLLSEKTGWNKNRKLLAGALLAWFVLNLVQAIFTELFHDEAYFWVFSRRLGFSYFDQMPAIAYWIKAGTSLLPGEIGLRLFTVLSSVPVLYGIYRLSETYDPRWFIFFVYSVLIIHVAGFMTAPDSVLGLSIVLFLLAYKRWTRTPDISSSLLLAIAGAFVCYSKYQGIAFIMIIFLLNMRKWNTITFWIPPLVTAVLVAPVYFSSPLVIKETLAFHLAGRNGGQTPLQLYTNFIGSQLAVLGPFVFPYLLIATWKFRSADFFYASLRKAILIYYGVLLVISFRSNVEGNWCGPAVPGMIILSIKYWNERPRAWKFARYVLAASLFVLLVARVYLIWDFLPRELSLKLHPEYHHWKKWAAQIDSVCGNEHVAFSNSYQCASKYWYYSGNPAICTNNSRYRKNQFSIMPMEAEWQGQPAWFAEPYPRVPGLPAIEDPCGRVWYLDHYTAFYSYYDVAIHAVDLPEQLSAGDTSLIDFQIGTTNGTGKKLIAEKEGRMTLGYWWMNERGEYVSFDDSTNWNGTDLPPQGLRKNVPIITPSEPGNYQFCIYFIVDHHGFSTNSDPVKIRVK